MASLINEPINTQNHNLLIFLNEYNSMRVEFVDEQSLCKAYINSGRSCPKCGAKKSRHFNKRGNWVPCY